MSKILKLGKKLLENNFFYRWQASFYLIVPVFNKQIKAVIWLRLDRGIKRLISLPRFQSSLPYPLALPRLTHSLYFFLNRTGTLSSNTFIGQKSKPQLIPIRIKVWSKSLQGCPLVIEKVTFVENFKRSESQT